MSFEQLQAVILAEAKRQVDKVHDRFDQATLAEEKIIKDKARAVEEDIIAAAEKEGQLEAQRLHQSAQLKARADVLLAKQTALDQVLVAAKQAVLAWTDEERRKLISRLLELVDESGGRIVAGERDALIVRELTTKKRLAVDEQVIENEGGLIYRGERTEINLTVGVLLRQLFDRERAAVAKVLFQ